MPKKASPVVEKTKNEVSSALKNGLFDAADGYLEKLHRRQDAGALPVELVAMLPKRGTPASEWLPELLSQLKLWSGSSE